MVAGSQFTVHSYMLQALSTVAAGGGGLQVYPLGKLFVEVKT
jgi:hypothetical protein